MPICRWIRALAGALALSLTVAAFAADECAAPVLVLHTDAGAVEIALAPSAAPRSVARLLNSDYADGLSFDVTRPNVSLQSTPLLGHETDLPMELSAAALGLHERTLDTPGAAHAIVQDHLVPAYRRSLRGDALGETLQTWLTRWYDSYDPSFLLGTSMGDVHRALGIPDTPGLDSRPVTRGSVALVPAGPDRASSKLAFFLSDSPAKTGRWPVIGEVTSGMEHLTAISRAPRHPRSLAHTTAYTPKDPVAIHDITHRCTTPSGDGASADASAHQSRTSGRPAASPSKGETS
ncbi:MAG: hypothetical protein AAFU65_09605 [Pseudomonadota bacterium]